MMFLTPSYFNKTCETCLLSALAELGEMEGYGHAYIGPFNPTLCHAASLFTQHWEAGLASPGCLDDDWLNLPPVTPPIKVLKTVLRFFRWAHVAVISGEEVIWYHIGLKSLKWTLQIEVYCSSQCPKKHTNISYSPYGSNYYLWIDLCLLCALCVFTACSRDCRSKGAWLTTPRIHKINHIFTTFIQFCIYPSKVHIIWPLTGLEFLFR